MKKLCNHLIVRQGLFYRDYKCNLSDTQYQRDKKKLCSKCPLQLSLFQISSSEASTQQDSI